VGNDRLQGARLIAVAALALMLFNFPLLAVFDLDRLVFGVPVLWAYLFFVWGAVIVLAAWVGRS
jgi:hypothetical protein